MEKEFAPKTWFPGSAVADSAWRALYTIVPRKSFAPAARVPASFDPGRELPASLTRDAQPARGRDLALPPPAQGQPGGLVSVGRRGARTGEGGGEAHPRLDRLLGLPLVPRDGARVVRGPADRVRDERALRVHQGGPRGTPRRRRDLHGGLPGHDGPGRLAAQRLPHTQAGAVLRGHLLPARSPPRPAELAPGARRHRPGLAGAARRDRRHLGAARGTAARWGVAEPVGRGTRPEPAGRGGRHPARLLRPHQRRLRQRAQVPTVLSDRVPAAPRRDRDERSHPARDGLRRNVRPGGRRVRALLGGPALDRPPLREDALRQRPARPRVPAWLAGHRRAAVRAGLPRNARLGHQRDARARGRLLLRARRRLRGRGGEVLRLDPRRGARVARRRRPGRNRLLRHDGGRQLRGREHPSACRPRAAGQPRVDPAPPLPGARQAGLARSRRQAPDGLERADDLGAGRGRRGAGRAALPGRRARLRRVRAAQPSRSRRPPAAHVQGRRGEAQRLPRGPRVPRGGAPDPLRVELRPALVQRRSRDRGRDDRALRRRAARRLLRDLLRSRAARGPAQGPGGQPDPGRQFERRLRAAAPGGAQRRALVRGARRRRAGPPPPDRPQAPAGVPAPAPGTGLPLRSHQGGRAGRRRTRGP